MENTLSIHEAKGILSTIIRESGNTRERIAALDRLARLSGWYKVNVSTVEPDYQAELALFSSLGETELRVMEGLHAKA